LYVCVAHTHEPNPKSFTNYGVLGYKFTTTYTTIHYLTTTQLPMLVSTN